MQTQIRIYTLGKCVIERDGRILENFLSTKTELLFIYLAMHPGEHAREKLASLLWSETNDEQSLKNLRTVLSSLRQQLDDVLEVSRKSLAIREDVSVWVDATIFETACANGFALPGTLDPLKQMEELAALYQGDFLANVKVRDAADLDDWLSAHQHRLREFYVQLLSSIVERALEQANYAPGLQYARKLVALDPLWDGARRQLMRLLAYMDRVNDAIVQYEQFARVLDEELGAAPDSETTRLYEQIKSGNVHAPAASGRRTMNSPDMLFVEPADDIEFAQRMLNAPQCRLLTLFGISGIGKTALATQIAFHRQHRYRDGAFVVSLSQTQSISSLPAMVAHAIGIDFAGTNDSEVVREIVIDELRTRELLLVLDNYEHLLPDTTFVEQVLDGAPQVQLIVASQTPLNLYREWLLPLKGLSVPDGMVEQPERYEAVRLFELTAQRINPRFRLADVLPDVVRICQLVDGMPLGLILAAGWTQVLPVSRIVEYIAEGMEFDLSYQQTLPERHQSIETVLEYTWNTLDAAQQQALTALAVFEGAFDLDAFSRLCETGMEVLAALIQKSLVVKSDESYRIHQLVRRYARRKLVYSPEKEALSRRYLDYYRHRFETYQQRALPVHEYMLAVEMEYANIWNYEWMPKSFQPIYTLTISRYLIAYWEIHQGHDLRPVLDFLSLLSLSDGLNPEWRALAHLQITRLLAHAGQREQAQRHLTQALNYACGTDAWHDQCMLLELYATVADRDERDPNQPEDGLILQSAYRALARLYLDMRDYESADGLYTQIHGSTQNRVQQALVLAARGAIAAATAAPRNAFHWYREALETIERSEHPRLALLFTSNLALLAGKLEQPADLGHYVGEALSQAAHLDAGPPLDNLLGFCAAMMQSPSTSDLGRDVADALCGLSADVRANHSINRFLADEVRPVYDCRQVEVDG